MGAPQLGALDVREAREWRAWLVENHLTKEGIWLIFHRTSSGTPTISYEDAVDEALAFGWIDSIIKRIDGKKYARKFTPRRPGSVWSKSNIARVERLRREGRMTVWGTEAYEKRTGEISLLERFNAQGVSLPKDFEAALRVNKQAWENFERMAPSHRKRYLIWIAGAKRPETRHRRIAEAVLLVGKNVKDLLK